jgi:micrococcal nuclease
VPVPQTRRAGTRRPARRPTGFLLALLGFALLVVVAVQWAGAVARDEAIDNALDDIPGPRAGAVLPASVEVPADAQEVTVDRIVDGDTLVVSAAAAGAAVPAGETRVRLIGVDTPEVDGPDTSQECFGPEASALAAELMPPGSTVLLSLDEEAQDRFDRTLAYAWTADGVFVNEAIVRNGASLALAYPPNDSYLQTLVDAEQAARGEGRGLWLACES